MYSLKADNYSSNFTYFYQNNGVLSFVDNNLLIFIILITINSLTIIIVVLLKKCCLQLEKTLGIVVTLGSRGGGYDPFASWIRYCDVSYDKYNYKVYIILHCIRANRYKGKFKGELRIVY